MNYIKNLRECSPLIHNITNYVTVNDVANVLLAIGASPIMSDAPEEAEEMTSISSGLNINIGTLNNQSVETMHLSGKKASSLNLPIVLDPVGAGATSYRTKTARSLINELNLKVIKGNISEIKALFKGTSTTNGVDASNADLNDDLSMTIDFIKKASKENSLIIALTGKEDIISDGDKTYIIKNGSSHMKNVTGTGCMVSAMITAFVAANKDHPLEATAAAVMSMGIAGEIALEKLKEGEGNLTYRKNILDALSLISDKDLLERGKYEIK